MTTTASNKTEDSDNNIVTFFCVPMLTSLVSYPIKLTIRISLLLTFKVILPYLSVVVPLLTFFIVSLAYVIGSWLVASSTFPVILCCALAFVRPMHNMINNRIMCLFMYLFSLVIYSFTQRTL